MGVFLVALAKLHLLSPAVHGGLTTPLLATLICPFVIKVGFSLRIVRDVYVDMLDATRLFCFQLSQIAFDQAGGRQQSPANGERWQRALRLVSQRITHARRPDPTAEYDEDSFHTFTMVSL